MRSLRLFAGAMLAAGLIALSATAADPSPSCVRVMRDNAAGSGTVIHCADGKSCVLSNNHVFADQPYPGAPFPRAPYPIPAAVQTRDGKLLRGVAIDGDADADLALVVIDGELPA